MVKKTRKSGRIKMAKDIDGNDKVARIPSQLVLACHELPVAAFAYLHFYIIPLNLPRQVTV